MLVEAYQARDHQGEIEHSRDNAHIGYDNAARIAKKAHHDGTTLLEAGEALGLVTAQQLAEWIKPEAMTHA